jgi:hypothetical protein
MDRLRQHAGAMTSDHEPTADALDLVRSAQFLQEHRRCIDALREAALHSGPFRCEAAAHRPHDVVELGGFETLLKHPDELRDERDVSRREGRLRFRDKLVDDSGARAASTGAALTNRSLALQHRQVSAHGIVGQLQSRGELVCGQVGAAQQVDDPAARALEGGGSRRTKGHSQSWLPGRDRSGWWRSCRKCSNFFITSLQDHASLETAPGERRHSRSLDATEPASASAPVFD